MVAGILLDAADHVHPQTPSKLAGTPKREWIWQDAYHSTHLTHNLRQVITRRYPLSPSTVQKAVHKAAKLCRFEKRITRHTLRHSFATHLLESDYQRSDPADDTQHLCPGQVSAPSKTCSATKMSKRR
jgi:integrase